MEPWGTPGVTDSGSDKVPLSNALISVGEITSYPGE